MRHLYERRGSGWGLYIITKDTVYKKDNTRTFFTVSNLEQAGDENSTCPLVITSEI